VSSDAAVATALSINPSQVLLLDEIGRFLQTTNTAGNKSPHLFNVISTFLKLYSSATEIWRGKQYADPKKQIKVDNPNLCIYGTTVPEMLYNGLTVENITDGFISRMLIFESEDPDPEIKDQYDMTRPPPASLIAQIKRLYNKSINCNPVGSIDIINCNPMIVQTTDTAKEMIKEFGQHIRILRQNLRNENRIDVIYNRCPMIAQQIALIVTIGKNIDTPVITEVEMLYGINLVQYLFDNMLYITENYIADNAHECEVKKVLKVIKKAGESGVSLSQLTHRTQGLKTRDRVDILTTLKDSEQIIEYMQQTKTKPVKKFRCL